MTDQQSNDHDPPIVVTRDGWLMSGARTVARHHERGETTGPAIVLDADYEGATDEERDRLHRLAARLQLMETDEEYRR